MRPMSTVGSMPLSRSWAPLHAGRRQAIVWRGNADNGAGGGEAGGSVGQRVCLVREVNLGGVHLYCLAQQGLDVRHGRLEPGEQRAQALVIGQVQRHAGADGGVLHLDRHRGAAAQPTAVHLRVIEIELGGLKG
eukprot:scaffold12846_cov119-Isochrysis_galbana.AAC.3